MAIQTRTATLKLADDAAKTLGASNLTADAVTCAQGLKENTDFAVDRALGTIRRLKPFDRTLYAFTFKYDDRAEVFAAQAQKLAAARAGIANLNSWTTITADGAQAAVDTALAFGGKTEAEALAAVDAAGNITALKPIIKQIISALYAVRAVDEKTARLLVHLRDLAV